MRIAATILFIILTINTASAAYITGDIFLDEQGNARFDIETETEINLEGLQKNDNTLTGTTNQLLTFKGGVWSFEISLEEFDDIFIDVHLPTNLISIRSVEGSDSIIDIEEKVVTIADSGKLDFKMSYRLREQKNYSWVWWLTTIFALIIVFLTYKNITKKRERFEHIMPMINDKEQNIIDILMKKPMRQKELRKKLELPKASFSRYMVNLEKKKLIIREGDGKNKLVRLK